MTLYTRTLYLGLSWTYVLKVLDEALKNPSNTPGLQSPGNREKISMNPCFNTFRFRFFEIDPMELS